MSIPQEPFTGKRHTYIEMNDGEWIREGPFQEQFDGIECYFTFVYQYSVTRHTCYVYAVCRWCDKVVFSYVPHCPWNSQSGLAVRDYHTIARLAQRRLIEKLAS